jgi:hypothetical protein
MTPCGVLNVEVAAEKSTEPAPLAVKPVPITGVVSVLFVSTSVDVFDTRVSVATFGRVSVTACVVCVFVSVTVWLVPPVATSSLNCPVVQSLSTVKKLLVVPASAPVARASVPPPVGSTHVEADGTVDAAGGVPVFCESSNGGWYELGAALQGVIEFHVIARDRYGYAVDLAGLDRLRNKLDLGAPLFDDDLIAAKRAIVSCKQQAGRLRVSQAVDIVDTVRISMALENLQGASHAAHA